MCILKLTIICAWPLDRYLSNVFKLLYNYTIVSISLQADTEKFQTDIWKPRIGLSYLIKMSYHL